MMSSAFEVDRDWEALAAPNAQDAGEGIGHEEYTQQENAVVRPESAFEDDSDEDLEEMSDDYAPPPATNVLDLYSSMGTQDKENEDSSWLGATDEDLSAKNDKTPTKRPYDLILDSPRKRNHDELEPEQEPEDLLEPQTSPNTRKRLRIERERGFAYEHRPTTFVRGWQVDEYDNFGVINLNIPCHYHDTLKRYGPGLGKKDEKLAGRRMGKNMPAYPDLPGNPSPLGQDVHKDGKWMGVSAIPLPRQEEQEEEEEDYRPSQVDSDWVDCLDEDDMNRDADGSQPPHATNPAPDYGEDEDLDDDQEQTDAIAGEERDDSSPSRAGEDDCSQQADESTPPLTRTPSLTFDQVLDIQPMGDWADEDDDDAFFNAIKVNASISTRTSVVGETISESTVIGDSDNEHQMSEYIGQDHPNSNDNAADSETSLSNPDSEGPSPSYRPASLERHPSSRETGREVGQFSKPLPRDDEMAQLKLENAKLVLEIIKEQKRCEERRQDGNNQFNALLTAYNDLQTGQRDFGQLYQKLRDKHYKLQYSNDYLKGENDDLKGEILAVKQRAEYDAEKLAKDRAEQDVESLAYINGLKQEAASMKTWAESLDADAEPMRLANDALTVELKAAEKASEVLKKHVKDANTTITELKAEVQDVAVQGARVTKLYNDCISKTTAARQPAAKPQPTSTPSSPAKSPSSPPRTPRPILPSLLPPIGETREAREARWRRLGACKATRDARRKARDEDDAQYNADRELRLQAYTAATGLIYVEGDPGMRRKELMRIVEEHSKSPRRMARVV